MSKNEELPVFRLDPMAEADATLAQIKAVVSRYPLAVQAAVYALAAEGRAFGATPEGHAWRVRLRGSRLVQRLRTTWEGITEQGFSVDAPETLPSVLIDRLVHVAMGEGLEPILSSFFEERSRL